MRMLGKTLSVCALFVATSCTTVYVASDRPARVYWLGAWGLEEEGEITPGEILSVSAFLQSSPFGIACVAGETFAFTEIPSGGTHRFEGEDWQPASEHLETALRGKIARGMTELEVVCAWGKPESAGEPSPSGNKTLQFVRGFTIYFLVFKDGVLDTWDWTYAPGHHDYFCW